MIFCNFPLLLSVSLSVFQVYLDWHVPSHLGNSLHLWQRHPHRHGQHPSVSGNVPSAQHPLPAVCNSLGVRYLYIALFDSYFILSCSENLTLRGPTLIPSILLVLLYQYDCCRAHPLLLAVKRPSHSRGRGGGGEHASGSGTSSQKR